MPRLPRYGHLQAAKRGAGKFAWAPGWRGTGQQPIRRVPITAYSHLVTSVPLNGGQVQGRVSGSSASYTNGSFTSPGTFTLLGTLTFPTAGQYLVTWTVILSGTLSATDANNFQVFANDGNTLLETSVNPGTAGSYVQAAFLTTVTAPGNQVFLGNPVGGTSGSVYSSVMAATSVIGNPVSSGPGAGLGTVWYPIQAIYLHIDRAARHVPRALVYLGVQGSPASLVPVRVRRQRHRRPGHPAEWSPGRT